ncbi:hypothetical protein HOD29_01135 [archaeon]|jgi:hypothetical protein|nr:hypothetical protein [archaeon]
MHWVLFVLLLGGFVLILLGIILMIIHHIKKNYKKVLWDFGMILVGVVLDLVVWFLESNGIY